MNQFLQGSGRVTNQLTKIKIEMETRAKEAERAEEARKAREAADLQDRTAKSQAGCNTRSKAAAARKANELPRSATPEKPASRPAPSTRTKGPKAGTSKRSGAGVKKPSTKKGQGSKPMAASLKAKAALEAALAEMAAKKDAEIAAEKAQWTRREVEALVADEVRARTAELQAGFEAAVEAAVEARLALALKTREAELKAQFDAAVEGQVAVELDRLKKELAKSAIGKGTTVVNPEPDEESSGLVGLVNSGNCCYANAATQCIFSALSVQDINRLRGEDELDPAALDTASLIELEGQGRTSISGSRAHKKLVAKTKELAGTNARTASYFGQVLKDISGGSKEERKVATQIFFQHLIAEQKRGWGTAWNGVERQQDTAEYLDALLDMLEEEGINCKNQWESSISIRRECKRCGNSVESTQEHRSLRPVVDHKKPVLVDLVNDYLHREEHQDHLPCSECKEVGHIWESSDVIALPDNLIVAIQRPQEHFFTQLAVPYGETIQFGAKEYRVAAVIKHKGPNHDKGHYWAVRQEKDQYHIFDDKIVTPFASAGALKDSRQGRTCLVLLRAVRAEIEA